MRPRPSLCLPSCASARAPLRGTRIVATASLNLTLHHCIGAVIPKSTVMRYIAGYLLAVLGGNESPSTADVTAILSAAGVNVDQAALKQVHAAVAGKSLDELIAAGSSLRLSVVCACVRIPCWCVSWVYARCGIRSAALVTIQCSALPCMARFWRRAALLSRSRNSQSWLCRRALGARHALAIVIQSRLTTRQCCRHASRSARCSVRLSAILPPLGPRSSNPLCIKTNLLVHSVCL